MADAVSFFIVRVRFLISATSSKVRQQIQKPLPKRNNAAPRRTVIGIKNNSLTEAKPSCICNLYCAITCRKSKRNYFFHKPFQESVFVFFLKTSNAFNTFFSHRSLKSFAQIMDEKCFCDVPR